jgi:hypothetical protein
MKIYLIWVVAIHAPIHPFIGKHHNQFSALRYAYLIIINLWKFISTLTCETYTYRPLGYSQQNRSSFRNSLAAKYPRSTHNQHHMPLTTTKSLRGTEKTCTDTGAISKNGDLKCTSSVQTDISALPHQWRSETQLIGSEYALSGFTLPSKYNSPQANNVRAGKNSLR